MLDEYKSGYLNVAQQLKDWDTIDKNQLCRDCLANENNPELYNIYMSAIICRYWGLIPKFYKISENLATPLDCYNWLLDSIFYAFKHRQWENPDSAIYNDPTGPDKVINRCMKSSRLIHYQYFNRKKRRKNYQHISIEEFKEKFNTDSFDLEDSDSELDLDDLDVKDFVKQRFNNKEYFLAFILDCICFEDVYDYDQSTYKFNMKKLCKIFKNIDENYIHIFAFRYNLDYETVYQAAILSKNINPNRLASKIKDSLLRLKHCNFIMNCVER